MRAQCADDGTDAGARKRAERCAQQSSECRGCGDQQESRGSLTQRLGDVGGELVVDEVPDVVEEDVSGDTGDDIVEGTHRVGEDAHRATGLHHHLVDGGHRVDGEGVDQVSNAVSPNPVRVEWVGLVVAPGDVLRRRDDVVDDGLDVLDNLTGGEVIDDLGDGHADVRESLAVRGEGARGLADGRVVAEVLGGDSGELRELVLEVLGLGVLLRHPVVVAAEPCVNGRLVNSLAGGGLREDALRRVGGAVVVTGTGAHQVLREDTRVERDDGAGEHRGGRKRRCDRGHVLCSGRGGIGEAGEAVGQRRGRRASGSHGTDSTGGTEAYGDVPTESARGCCGHRDSPR